MDFLLAIKLLHPSTMFTFPLPGGFFSGTNDKFLSGLAAHIAQKKHILDDPICSALWKNASRIGEKLSETRRVKEQAEEEITHQAAAFSEKVYEAVSAGIKF